MIRNKNQTSEEKFVFAIIEKKTLTKKKSDKKPTFPGKEKKLLLRVFLSP